MLFLEYLLVAGIIFILWIVASLKKSTRDMHWVVLLITAVLLGAVTMVLYALQLTAQLIVKIVFKGSCLSPSRRSRPLHLRFLAVHEQIQRSLLLVL